MSQCALGEAAGWDRTRRLPAEAPDWEEVVIADGIQGRAPEAGSLIRWTPWRGCYRYTPAGDVSAETLFAAAGNTMSGPLPHLQRGSSVCPGVRGPAATDDLDGSALVARAAGAQYLHDSVTPAILAWDSQHWRRRHRARRR
jgi:hypothetical protein